MAGDIQFDEEPQYQKPVYQVKQKSFLTRLVLATGIVSTDKGAESVLLGIAAFAIILAIALPILIK